MDKRTFLGGMAAAPWLLSACGGGNDGAVRMVHASAGLGALDWWVAGDRKAQAVAFGGSSGYLNIDSGGKQMSVSSAGSSTALLTADVSVPPRAGHRSWVVYGAATALKALTLDDDSTTPSSNYTTIRILHTASDAGNVDVYLMDASSDAAGATVLSSSPALNTLVAAGDVTAGLKRLRVTAAGQSSQVLLDVPQVACAGGGVTTLVLTAATSGALIGALQLDQQGAVTPLVNPQARLRVVAALHGPAAVTVSAQGVALMTQAVSPSLQPYTAVASGPAALAVTVGGAAVAVPTLTLASGGDHTLLITGTSASDATFTLLTDDNRAPSPTTSAAVRLVHAISSLPTTTVSLQVDYATLIGGQPFASASAPVALTPRTTANVRVVTASGAVALQLTDQVLAAGSVYSVFVFNDSTADATTGVIVQDR